MRCLSTIRPRELRKIADGCALSFCLAYVDDIEYKLALGDPDDRLENAGEQAG